MRGRAPWYHGSAIDFTRFFSVTFVAYGNFFSNVTFVVSSVTLKKKQKRAFFGPTSGDWGRRGCKTQFRLRRPRAHKAPTLEYSVHTKPRRMLEDSGRGYTVVECLNTVVECFQTRCVLILVTKTAVECLNTAVECLNTAVECFQTRCVLILVFCFSEFLYVQATARACIQ